MNYPSKPSSAPAIPFNSVGKSKVLNDIISAIGVEKLLALKTDGTYDDNFSIGDNSLNSLVNEINIREGSTIKEYDNTGANLLRTLTLGSATNLAQGFRYLDESIKISNNATSPSTEIDVSAGVMNFDDGTSQIRLTTSLTKSTANDFQNGGLLPNSAVLQTDTMYYVFAIYSTASNLVNFYADTSKTSPTLPTSPNVYDKKQYRGAFYVDASGNITTGSYTYFMGGYRFKYYSRILDLSISTLATARTPVPLSAPVESIAFFICQLNDNDSINPSIIFTEENEIDIAPSLTNCDFSSPANLSIAVGDYSRKVNASREIYYRSSDGFVDSFTINTLGWVDYL